MTWTCPSHELTWQYNVNQSVGSASTDTLACQSLMWGITSSLTGFALNPWTTHASSGWGSSGALTWNTAGSTHSWTVLENARNGAQVLIDLNSATVYYATIKFSASGAFTGGSSTTAPTASDSVTIVDAAAWGGPYDALTGKLHVWHDSTGGSSRIAFCRLGVVQMMVSVSHLTAQPGITWSPAACVAWSGYYDHTQPQATVAKQLTAYAQNGYYSGAAITMSAAFETWGSTSNVHSRSTTMTTTSAWALGAITGLWSSAGKMAIPSGASCSALPDVLIGSTTNATGSCYLNAGGEKKWLQLGCLVLPWNDSVPEIS